LGCHKSSPKLTEERREGPITIDPNVHVSEAYATVPHPETILAADSSDSGYLLAGAMTDDEPGHKSSVVGYFSRDGGKTWKLALKRTATTGREATEFYDPTVAFGPDGVAHFAVLRRSASKQQIEMALSRDRGQTWEKPITLPQTGADRPFIGSDNLRGRIYCDCTLSASRSRSVAVFTSRDGGKNFDPPKTLAVANPGPGLFPGPMAVLSDLLQIIRWELLTGLLLGGVSGLLVGFVALVWLGHIQVVFALLGGIAAGVAGAAVVGIAMPNLLHLLRRDPQVAAGPIALAVSDVLTLLLYLNLARWLLA
jgi:hypothetical protein